MHIHNIYLYDYTAGLLYIYNNISCTRVPAYNIVSATDVRVLDEFSSTRGTAGCTVPIQRTTILLLRWVCVSTRRCIYIYIYSRYFTYVYYNMIYAYRNNTSMLIILLCNNTRVRSSAFGQFILYTYVL